MDMMQVVAQHDVFSGFNEKEMEHLSAILSYRHAEKNKAIFEIDDLPNHIYYVLNGALTLHFPDNTKLNISPGELIGEIGILNGDFRLGKLMANEDSSLIAICTGDLLNTELVDPKISLEIIKRLSKRVTDYLRNLQNISSKEILLNGENEHVEFKSSLRWNLKARRNDKKIIHGVLKTIAAFLNTEGGILVIGVADDGSVVGTELDGFENDDKMLLFLTNVIKSNLGALHLEHIHYHTEKIDNKTVLRVDVQAGASPCYYVDDKLDYFYIRTGPATTNLRMRDLYDYIKKRFS